MKLRTVALLATLGVAASTAGAMAIPLPSPTSHGPVEVHPDPKVATDNAHFTAGQTLVVDGRLGHTSIARTGRGETYFFASVTGTPSETLTAPPLNLAIVVD